MLKVIKQHDEKDCGAACLSMIASYFGINISLIKAREKLKVDNNGCNIWAIVLASKELGFKASAFCFDELNDFQEEVINMKKCVPFIANVINEEGYSHFVIVEKITNIIKMVDPARGKIRLTFDEFLSCWTGVLISFEGKRQNKINVQMPFYISFTKLLMKENCASIIKIALESLIISCFSMIQVIILQKVLEQLLNGINHVHKLECEDLGKIDYLLYLLLENKYFLLIFFIGICFVQCFLKSYRGFQTNKLNCILDYSMFNNLLEKTMKLPYDFFENRRTGEIVTRFDEIYKVRNSFINIVQNIFCDTIFLFVLNIVIFIKCKEIIIIELGAILIYTVILFFQDRILKQKLHIALNKKELLFSHITKGFSSIEDIIHGKNNFFSNGTKIKLYEATKKLYEILNINTLFESCETLISDFFIIIVIILGKYLIIEKSFLISDFFVAFFVLSFVLQNIRNLCTIVISVENYRNSVERLEDILEAQEKNDLSINIDSTINILDFENVSFAYGHRFNVLEEVNFTIAKGEQIAFVGESGSGKTTIAKLILNYYDATRGKIVRGTNKIACLHQDLYVFNESIRNNILIGRTDISEKEFNYICHITRVDKIAEKRNEGYETIMDEKGTDFSMGEKQRIVLARTLLEKPELLILDEAGSALDALSEKQIIDDIRNEFRNISIIFITHRLSTIKNCDRIYILEKGKIKDCGSHYELINKCKTYKSFCDNQ